MLLFAICFSLHQVQQALSILTSVPLGPGFSEDEEKQEFECEIYPISMNYDESHPFNKMLSGKCKSSSRKDSKIRTSRSTAVIGAVVTIGFAFYVLGQNLYDSFVYKPHVEKQITLLQDALLKMQKAENLTIADIEELSDLFSAAQWAEISATIFETSKLEKIMNFLKLSSTELLKKFGFSGQIELDALRMFNYTFQCSEKPNKFILEVCGFSNPTRVFGTIHHVAPIGEFVQPGVYRYYQTPDLALLPMKGTLLSVEYCKKIGGHFSCFNTPANCTIKRPKACRIHTTVAADGVFTKDLSDATYVATDKTVTHYSIRDNITGLLAYKNVDRSGQFLIRASSTQVIHIGSKSIVGRHDVLEVTPIIVDNTIPHLSHEDIDEMKRLEKEANGMVDESKYETLHWGVLNMLTHASWAYLLEYCRNGLIACGVVLVVLVIGWCAWKCGCNKKEKKGEQFEGNKKEKLKNNDV
ncbi:hypothetical protein L5515_005647 [Caenorhabditis briggsae]|uniref:Glycoprotein n=1 Tax=Caenorhabditis briggsae TaxID=6238 RepID=A0AAE9EQP9_CAEBR|nr:hypothetical protein L5515_005647 [Caenorhabditis briggsae]